MNNMPRYLGLMAAMSVSIYFAGTLLQKEHLWLAALYIVCGFVAAMSIAKIYKEEEENAKLL